MALMGGESEPGSAGGEDESAGEVVAVSDLGDLGIAKVALKNVYAARGFAAVTESGDLAVRLCKPKWWPEVDAVTGKRIDDPATY